MIAANPLDVPKTSSIDPAKLPAGGRTPLIEVTQMKNLWFSTAIAAGLALLLMVLVATVARRQMWLSLACHLPHLLWVCFATYVTARMAQLNG
jgi:tryptophan-rich sensory protein